MKTGKVIMVLIASIVLMLIGIGRQSASRMGVVIG
jgi:hypothetical protein